MRRRTYLLFGLMSTLIFILLPVEQARGLPPRRARIKWNPGVLELTIVRGTAQSTEITCTATRDISGLSLRVVPALRRFLSVTDSGFGSLQARQPFTFGAFADIPSDTLVGDHGGVIQVRRQNNGRRRGALRGRGMKIGLRMGRTVPRPLPVILHVVEPTNTDIPDGAASPSQDRIVTDANGQELIKDEVVTMLGLDAPNPEDTIKFIAAVTGGVILGSIPETNTYQLQYPVADLAALRAKVAELDAMPQVKAAARNFIGFLNVTTPNDPVWDNDGEDWDEASPAGFEHHLELVGARNAWDTTTGSSSVNVAVIDGEFDELHEDLEDNVGIKVNPSGSVCVGSIRGHGTHVAGIIGAVGNNDIGVTGMAWTTNLQLYDISNFPCATTKAQEMMKDAAMNGAHIVNLSLGFVVTPPASGPPDDPAGTLVAVDEANATLGEAILWAKQECYDVLWVFSAGNKSRDAKFASPASLVGTFPANCITVASVGTIGDLSQCLTVAPSGELSWFSNFGPLVTVAAPGESIPSTIPPALHSGIKYVCLTGTSQAAPMVSGLAALIRSHDSTKTAAQLKRCIVEAAEASGMDLSPEHDFNVIHAPGAVTCSFSVDCSIPLWTSVGDDQFGAWLGDSLASAGDVNNDGYGDVIVGSVFYDTANEQAGKAYLYLGGPSGLSSVPDWTSTGDDQGDAYYGSSVASAGDVNDDGYDDVIIGAHFIDTANPHAGKAYLYLGGPSGLPLAPAWTSSGEDIGGALFGSTVASAGDVNRDGFDDVIIAAVHYTALPKIWVGKTYVYLGGPGGLSGTPDWSATGDDQDNALFASSADGAGDVNRDGYDDVIVGARRAFGPGGTRVGKAYVYHGGPGGLSLAVSWDSAGDDQGDAQFGGSVASIGDVNCDGFDDVLIGARRYDTLNVDAGKAYVYLGGSSGLSATPGWTTSGDDQAGALLGHSVASAGDVDADGINDVIVGAYSFDTGVVRAGKVYVYRGGPGGLSLTPYWASSGDNLSVAFGYTVASAGDVYGDGYDRVLVGVPWMPSGKAYLFCAGP